MWTFDSQVALDFGLFGSQVALDFFTLLGDGLFVSFFGGPADSETFFLVGLGDDMEVNVLHNLFN